METLLGIIVLAITWHVGLAIIEYQCRPEKDRPSLAKLLLLAEVEAEIRRSMGEVVTSMRSVALFFAPLVTSVAARMQGLLSSKTASSGFLGSTEVSPPAFPLVLGICIVLLTAILINYVVEIELGEDGLAKRMAIASALPVALGVFTAGAILGGQMLGALIG